jgi:hypothetical protein
VASKHDGKVARANMWVTKQNLARSMGGRPGFQFQGRKKAAAPAAPAASSTADALRADNAESNAAKSDDTKP